MCQPFVMTHGCATEKFTKQFWIPGVAFRRGNLLPLERYSRLANSCYEYTKLVQTYIWFLFLYLPELKRAMLDSSCANDCTLNRLPGPMRHWFTSFTHSHTQTQTLCHDAHIFSSISAKHTQEQHWNALGWGCHPVWLHVEYQKACLQAPHVLEGSKSPLIKRCKAVEHVVPSMLGITGQIQVCTPNFGIPFNECPYRKQFQTQPTRGRKPTWSIDCCFQQGLQTITKHLRKKFVCGFDYSYRSPVFGLLQIPTFRNHCEQRVSPK